MKNNITSNNSQVHRMNQNPRETVIRELRNKWHRNIFRSNCPRALWPYGLPHFAKTMQIAATNTAGLNGQTLLVTCLVKIQTHLHDFDSDFMIRHGTKKTLV